MGNAVLTGCIVLSCIDVVLSARKCAFGSYADLTTNLCRPCSDICQEGKMDRECRRKCPEYEKFLSTRNLRRDKTLDLAVYPPHQCPLGMYFDHVVGRCDVCSSICQDHEIQKTSRECKMWCPNEYRKSLKTTDGQTDGVATIVVPVVVGVGFIVTVVALVLARRKYLSTQRTPRQHHKKTQPEDVPLFLLNRSSDQSATVSAVSSAVVIPPEQAHPDLPMDTVFDTTVDHGATYNDTV